MGVEITKTFAIPGAGRVELGFTLLPPGSSESEQTPSSEVRVAFEVIAMNDRFPHSSHVARISIAHGAHSSNLHS
jgi:hypothetical protein